MIFHDVLLATATTISTIKVTSGMGRFNYALVGMGTTGGWDLSNFGMHSAGFCDQFPAGKYSVGSENVI
jgi:hypothetical protein